MAQNEMKAKPALPERVRSMEGLGVALDGQSNCMPNCSRSPDGRATEALRGAEVLPMRSSGPTDWITFALERACAGADHSCGATRNEEAELSDPFFAAPIDLDFESVSFKARSDRKSLEFSQHAALRRLTFKITGAMRQDGLGQE